MRTRAIRSTMHPMTLRGHIWLHRSRGACAFSRFIVLVCVAFLGCAVGLIMPMGRGQVVPKELNMQPPTDPRNPPKSSPPIPEMVGATSAPFYIGPGVTQISFPIHPPTGPALLRD